jgi:mRNA interferase MazF
MTDCERGDLVLVSFVFSDETGAKRRPVLVLSTAEYHRGRREAIVAAVTSNVERELVGDHRIKAWKEAGLPLASTVTAILRTIRRDMIVTRLGALRPADLRAVDLNLRAVLAL